MNIDSSSDPWIPPEFASPHGTAARIQDIPTLVISVSGSTMSRENANVKVLYETPIGMYSGESFQW